MCLWRRYLSALILTPVLASTPAAYADAVNIPVTGTISGTCSLTKGSDFPPANLATNGSVPATAIVNCSTAFKIRATSANGALKNVKPAQTNFTNTQPYTLTVSVPLDSGGPATSSCLASGLIAGQSACALAPAGAGLSSGTASATNKTATLTAAWTVPTLPTRLLAGAYSDTISISISAAP
jgi:hypothetical protein